MPNSNKQTPNRIDALKAAEACAVEDALRLWHLKCTEENLKKLYSQHTLDKMKEYIQNPVPLIQKK